uniref:winged helix-turn-helix transcriptional regulator n=1 Tax=Amycolatopsis endophytica TaxID=860233 RepID=UPI001C538717
MPGPPRPSPRWSRCRSSGHAAVRRAQRNSSVGGYRDGFATRRAEDTVPPHVHYRLTGLGLSLEAALAVVREWAEAHRAEIDRNRS